MNPQTAYAMTTQTSPLFQAMSLPVSTLAANEMAPRASMNTAPRRPAAAPPRAGRTGPPPSAVVQTGPCAWPFVVRSLMAEAGAGRLVEYQGLLFL